MVGRGVVVRREIDEPVDLHATPVAFCCPSCHAAHIISHPGRSRLKGHCGIVAQENAMVAAVVIRHEIDVLAVINSPNRSLSR